MTGTTGTWEPGAASAPDAELLQRIADAWTTGGEAGVAEFADENGAVLRSLMQQGPGALDAVLADVPADVLDAAARFCTLLERRPGFEAGARSPVIAFVRALRVLEHDSAELVAWIRANTDNRFLPHGSLQDRLRR